MNLRNINPLNPLRRNRNKKGAAYLPILKCLFFIIDWDKAETLTGVFAEAKVRFHFAGKGRGTANSEMLQMLGLGATDKAVFLCLEQDVMVPTLVKKASEALGFYKPGAGIAFSVPLSGVNNLILKFFKQSVKKEVVNPSDLELYNMKTEIKHELILVIVNQGYSDELMVTARQAGARGGTVIGARGLMHQGPVKFFGISVQQEKEIIFILSGKEEKIPIMEAISRDFGASSQAGGLVFSLPVDMVKGLNLS
ncbi:MAG: hypothetical protein LBQ61_08430 [Spirochaetales bacterium]|jgi:hypothetical protein|nr:hypothetical protein [Spirochaetales bacterium]